MPTDDPVSTPNSQPVVASSTGRAWRDEISLLDYWRVVVRHRRMILGCTLLVALIAGVVSLLSPKVYMATTTIVPPLDMLQKDSGLAGRLGGARQSLLKGIIDVSGIGEMYVGVLRSRVVADRMIDRFDLLRVYEKVRNRTDARKRLEENTNAIVGEEGIIRITVKDYDPNRAAAIANAYVEELDRQNRRLSSGQASTKRVFLETRLAEIKSELSKIENLPTREAQIKEMLFEMLAREYELAKIEEAKSMPTIQVLDEASPPEARMARGTVKKAMMAGLASFLLAMVAAFAYESVQTLRKEETLRDGNRATA